MTRSASAGTSPGSRVNGGVSTTRSTSCPAAHSAASGSVNCGWTTTARSGASARATSTNASAAPAVRSTCSGGLPCLRATAARARVGSGYAASRVSAPTSTSCSHAGGAPARTFTARSTRPGSTSASPCCRGRCQVPCGCGCTYATAGIVGMVVGHLRGAQPMLVPGQADPVDAGVTVHPDARGQRSAVADPPHQRPTRRPPAPTPRRSALRRAARRDHRRRGDRGRTGHPTPHALRDRNRPHRRRTHHWLAPACSRGLGTSSTAARSRAGFGCT